MTENKEEIFTKKFIIDVLLLVNTIAIKLFLSLFVVFLLIIVFALFLTNNPAILKIIPTLFF